MKKIIYILLLIGQNTVSNAYATRVAIETANYFTSALTAGYVFKRGDRFKQVYGHGMVNIMTADLAYTFKDVWGIGGKAAYWRAHGQTTFLLQPTSLQEVPITLYLSRAHDFDSGLQIYGSLGGGLAWIKEKSYLGTIKLHKGIGEMEVGMSYSACNYVSFTMATRYLFPPQMQVSTKKDIGGVDLRAGFSIDW